MTLRLDRVTYRYAGFSRPALVDVSLDVAPGEVVGVVGANESGKSTLALVAAGLAPATIGGRLEGRVEVDGRSTHDLQPHEIAARCGVLFQNPVTQLSGTAETVWEEVAFGPRNLGLPLDEIVERVEASLATLHIDALAPRRPGRLSGGQAQLVVLASVLAMRPAVLVLDEPTSQLDPRGTQLVRDALVAIVRGGAAVLIAEHKTNLLEALSSRVVALEAGRVALSGTTEDVLEDPALGALGVEAPTRVRLRRALAASGLPEPAVRAARVAIEAATQS